MKFMGLIYIEIKKAEGEAGVFAINTRTDSYGWAGSMEVARPPYFKVVGVRDNRLVLEQLEEGSPDFKCLEENFNHGRVVSDSSRKSEQDVRKFIM